MKKTPVMALIDAGTAFHFDSYDRPPLKGNFDRILYLRDLPRADLSDVDILIIPCRTNPHWLGMNRALFIDFMRAGGTLMVMGETRPDTWLDDVGYAPMETNFWWWLEEGADLGVHMCAEGHSINAHISKKEAQYHLHATFTPLGKNQQSLIATKEGESIMFEDKTTYAPGRLVATTLDPFFHHGQFFMPATTEFLKKFLPWLRESHSA